jgi:hypothetical protein
MKLTILNTLLASDIQELLNFLSESDLPNEAIESIKQDGCFHLESSTANGGLLLTEILVTHDED